VPRRRRSARRRFGAFVAEIVVALVGLAIMLAIVIPWASGETERAAERNFLPSPSPAVVVEPED
jgi:hypothetical protein